MARPRCCWFLHQVHLVSGGVGWGGFIRFHFVLGTKSSLCFGSIVVPSVKVKDIYIEVHWNKLIGFLWKTGHVCYYFCKAEKQAKLTSSKNSQRRLWLQQHCSWWTEPPGGGLGRWRVNSWERTSVCAEFTLTSSPHAGQAADDSCWQLPPTDASIKPALVHQGAPLCPALGCRTTSPLEQCMFWH